MYDTLTHFLIKAYVVDTHLNFVEAVQINPLWSPLLIFLWNVPLLPVGGYLTTSFSSSFEKPECTVQW